MEARPPRGRPSSIFTAISYDQALDADEEPAHRQLLVSQKSVVKDTWC